MKPHRIAAAGTLALLGLGTLGWSVASNNTIAPAEVRRGSDMIAVQVTHRDPALAKIATDQILAAYIKNQESVAPGSYGVDSTHSSVIFRIKHAGVTNFYGRFNKLTGSWTFDPDDLSTASFEFEIDNASVMTGAPDRDNHIKSPDFFNVKQFPTTSFKSTKLEAASGGMYTLTGDLTFHGETHAITANFEYMGEGSFRGKDVASFEATFEFNRRDFGMTTYGAADGSDSGMLGNTIKIIVSVEGPKK